MLQLKNYGRSKADELWDLAIGQQKQGKICINFKDSDESSLLLSELVIFLSKLYCCEDFIAQL